MRELIEELIEEAKRLNKNPIDLFEEKFNAKRVSEYSDEVMEELKKAGYKFGSRNNRMVFIHVNREKQFFCIKDKKDKIKVFTKANIIIDDMSEFVLGWARKYNEELYKNLKEEINRVEKIEKIQKAWEQANGVVWESKTKDEVEKEAKKYGCKCESFNVETEERGIYFHAWFVRTDIDDYIVFGAKTKGKREFKDLQRYIDYKYHQIPYMKLDKEKVCFECGNRFTFNRLKADNPDKPVWEQLARKFDMWRESYCGC